MFRAASTLFFYFSKIGSRRKKFLSTVGGNAKIFYLNFFWQSPKKKIMNVRKLFRASSCSILKFNRRRQRKNLTLLPRFIKVFYFYPQKLFYKKKFLVTECFFKKTFFVLQKKNILPYKQNFFRL